CFLCNGTRHSKWDCPKASTPAVNFPWKEKVSVFKGKISAKDSLTPKTLIKDTKEVVEDSSDSAKVIYQGSVAVKASSLLEPDVWVSHQGAPLVALEGGEEWEE
ncbi:hypothetical protein KI387_009041, partial [Taxus chinensis]